MITIGIDQSNHIWISLDGSNYLDIWIGLVRTRKKFLRDDDTYMYIKFELLLLGPKRRRHACVYVVCITLTDNRYNEAYRISQRRPMSFFFSLFISSRKMLNGVSIKIICIKILSNFKTVKRQSSRRTPIPTQSWDAIQPKQHNHACYVFADASWTIQFVCMSKFDIVWVFDFFCVIDYFSVSVEYDVSDVQLIVDGPFNCRSCTQSANEKKTTQNHKLLFGWWRWWWWVSDWSVDGKFYWVHTHTQFDR